jgi:hypothetical protein
MSHPRFLCDENLLGLLPNALLRREPGIDLLCVGDPGAPPRKTRDPALLLAADLLRRVLLTRDRDSMVQHLINHYAAGHHTHGVILLRDGFPLSQYLDEIILIWGATSADEWLDQTIYFP